MLTKDELPPCPVATTVQLIGNKMCIRDSYIPESDQSEPDACQKFSRLGETEG